MAEIKYCLFKLVAIYVFWFVFVRWKNEQFWISSMYFFLVDAFQNLCLTAGHTSQLLLLLVISAPVTALHLIKVIEF